MNDVVVGSGKLVKKGVYAARDFRKGEVVKLWNLRKLSQAQFDALPKDEHKFVHSFWGGMYLFPEPSRYTNHSANPNTTPDWENMCDIAARDIKKGEMITTNATNEVRYELKTFVEAYEKNNVHDLKYLKTGYRNSICRYNNKDVQKTLVLKRVNGNWQIIKEDLTKNLRRF